MAVRLETSLGDNVLSPIDDSASSFDTVERIFHASFPGFIFHCVLSPEERPQLTHPVAGLRSGRSNLLQQIGCPTVVRVCRTNTGQGDRRCVRAADRSVDSV